MILISSPMFAQGHDVALWNKFTDGSYEPIPWYVWSNGRWTTDLRWNFDWKDSMTGLAGRQFGDQALLCRRHPRQ